MSTGEYDAIVSVEMIEAVGEEFWPSYFSTIDGHLAPGGRVAIQAITMAHDRMLETRNSYGWIQKHIFPGGLIPSIQAIEDVCGKHTSLHITQRRELGVHYAETLRRWRLAFVAHWDDVAGLGLRRELPPDLGVLPRLLRGRLPVALPRRQPDPAGPAPPSLSDRSSAATGMSTLLPSPVRGEVLPRNPSHGARMPMPR